MTPICVTCMHYLEIRTSTFGVFFKSLHYSYSILIFNQAYTVSVDIRSLASSNHGINNFYVNQVID